MHIDLLHRCDQDCVHCYLPSHRHTGLTTDRYYRLLDELAEAGALHLVFSGGEVFLRPDLLPILRRARERRFHVELITNGASITEEAAGALAEIGVAKVGVSLHSMVPTDHEAITRRPGSHARAVAGIRRLVEQGVPVALKCRVMRANRSSWRSVYSWSEEIGCTATADGQIMARVDGDTSNVEACELDPGSRVEVARLLLEREPHRFHVGETTAESPACAAGHTRCYVDPTGKVYPCVNLPWDVGDVTQEPFPSIWRSSPRLKELRGLTRRSFPECRECHYLGRCAPCPAQRYLATGRLTGPCAALCLDTHVFLAAAHEAGLYAGPVGLPSSVDPSGHRRGLSSPAVGS